jgi:hypothetical protein
MRTRSWVIAALVVLLASMAAYVRWAPPAQADTGTCTTVASKDSWTDKKVHGANHGTENVLRALIKSQTLRYPHVGFDVTCLPAGATITAARVEFTPRITINQTNLRVWKSAVATWNETTLTWSNQPATVANSNTPARQQHAANVPETYELPGAGLPNGNGLVAYQMRELATGSNPEVEFHSREAATGDPRLLIDWTTPGTTTTTSTTTTTTLPPPTCVQMNAYATPQDAINATPVGGCVDANADYALTSTLNLNKDITLNCPVAGHGFHTLSGTFELVRVSASGATIDGCDFYGSGATTSTAAAVNFSGSISDVKLDNLDVRNLQTGTVGDSGIQHDITVEDSLFQDIGGTGTAWYYGQESYNINLLRNTYRRTQRNGQTGQAGIQSGGSELNRHHNWTIRGNLIDNQTCGAGDQVDIGLDQITNSVIGGPLLADRNTVLHCNSWGEGIVVNGSGNQILNNEVRGVRNGSITLITYPGAGAVQNVTVADNLVVGPGLGGGQGLALSFAAGGPAMTGLRILRNNISGHPYGIQAYAYTGPVLAGSDNLIQENTLLGNSVGPCSLPAPFVYTSVNNNPSC